MTDISLDQLAEGIMKLIRDLAGDSEIEAEVVNSLAAAYEAGYATAEQEHDEE